MNHPASQTAEEAPLRGASTKQAILGPQWLVVYTIVRHEKKVAGLLGKSQIETFLPSRTVRRQWKDRCVNVELPLFPGYLFVHIPMEKRFRVLNSPGVVRLLSSDGLPIPVPADQILALRTLVESQLVYEPVEYFACGREVVVKRGGLTGVRGRVNEHRGSHRLIISADLIQRSVAVEIDVRDVELTP